MRSSSEIVRLLAIPAIVAFVAALTSSVATAQGGGPLQPDPDRIVYAIAPHDTDASINRFDSNNLVIYRHSTAANAPLLVFMPGTGGTPASARLFMDLASKVGYRVIGLMYDDTPAVNVVCPPVPDPKCSESFRQKRIYGDNVTNIIDDTPAESIVARLTKLLDYLNAHYPNDGWAGYLADGKPNWARIAVSGHSQGAGMAAFIAKDHEVYRVVLFSSPWDFYNPGRQARNVAFQTAGDSARPLVCGVSRARTGCGADVSHVSCAGYSSLTAASARFGTAPDAGRCCRRCDGIPLERRRRWGDSARRKRNPRLSSRLEVFARGSDRQELTYSSGLRVSAGH